MKRNLLLIFLILICTSISFAAEPTINFPGSQDSDEWFAVMDNRWQSGTDEGYDTLNEELDDSETGVDITSTPSSWPAGGGFYVQIEKEYMYVESIAANTLTVTRGVGGSSAATHVTSLKVRRILVAKTFDNLVDSIQAIQNELLNWPTEVVFGNGAWTCDSNDDGDCIDASEANYTSGATWLRFDDSVDEYAYSVYFKLPNNFSANVSLVFAWHAAATADDVEWCFQSRYVTGDGVDWSAWSTADCTVDTAAGTANYISIFTDGTFSGASSWDDNYLIQMRTYRDADDGGNDTMTGDASLDCLTVKYEVD